jgi:dTMP kinase
MGFFITFEGAEGSGKTTQIQRLAASLAERGYDIVTTREPGGTPIGNAIRSLLLDPLYVEMSAASEALLFNAARAQLVHQIIRPALDAGRIVLCDRYADSTFAYQGYGRGQDLALLRLLAAFATADLRPDLTIYLDIAPDEGLRRKRSDEWNRMEEQTLAFHETVRQGYFALMAEEPQRWFLIDASQNIEQIHNVILAHVLSRVEM